MDSTIWIILSAIIALAVIGIAIIFLQKKTNRKPDFYALFSLGIMWVPIGLVLKMYPLMTVGAFLAIIGLGNHSKWEKNKVHWDNLSTRERNVKLLLLGLTVLLALIGIWAFLINTKNV